jgi:hypothetical protein
MRAPMSAAGVFAALFAALLPAATPAPGGADESERSLTILFQSDNRGYIEECG